MLRVVGRSGGRRYVEGYGVPLVENKNGVRFLGFLVYCFQSVLAFCCFGFCYFLVVWFLGFLVFVSWVWVYWFLGFLVSKFLDFKVSKFQLR